MDCYGLIRKQLQRMNIVHLSLTNFRNFSRLELDFPAGATLIYGDNAQGKTNLLEAIYYLATTRSPYAAHDNQLINWHTLQPEEPLVVARMAAIVQAEQGERRIEMRLILEQQGQSSSFRREALVNRRKVRLMDLLSNLQVVQFLPQDVQVLTGAPAGRRRYLDITLCQTDPHYCRTLSAYNKVLEQRNATLRRIAEDGSGHDILPIFTEKLVNLGGEIFVRRARFLLNLASETQRIHYEELTNGQEVVRLGYLPRVQDEVPGRGDSNHELTAFQDIANWLADAPVSEVAERYQKELGMVRGKDIAQGRTSLGPHRDDWRIWVNGRDLASYGSRGQQRTAMLALKLGEINWMTSVTGDTPVLLLDEVVAELDEHRRGLLLDYVQRGAQAILTATDPGMFSERFLSQASTMRVEQGQVQLVTPPLPEVEPATSQV